jgi:hypothetical protein
VRRYVPAIVCLAIVVATALIVRSAHQTYRSWWLDAYLVIFAALPVLLATWAVASNQLDFKAFFRNLLPSLAGLLVMEIVYQRLTPSWPLACLAGVATLGAMIFARDRQLFTAQAKLAEAGTALNTGQHQKALAFAQTAGQAYTTRGMRSGQAASEWVIGTAYRQANQPSAAVRHLNAALVLYRSMSGSQQTEQVQKSLDELGVRPHALSHRESAELLAELGSRDDRSFLLEGIAAIAATLLLLQLASSAATASAGVLAVTGVWLFLLFFGNYVLLKARWDGAQRSAGSRAYNLALMVVPLGVWVLALGRGILRVADFPPALRGPIERLATLGRPGSWVALAALLIAAFVMLRAVARASGHSLIELARLPRAGARTRPFQLAMDQLEAGQWDAAIAELSRIDLPREKSQKRQQDILFYLAFAHYQLGKASESGQYLAQLLQADQQHPEGLYLAGYLSLQQNRLDEAERFWRTLCAIDQNFRPIGAAQDDRDARYYCSLTLYRKAMATIDQDEKAAIEILAEVGKIGAIDKAVADALVRVHLSRCAQFVRQRDWGRANEEVSLAQRKLEHLQALVKDAAEVSKLKGLSYAAAGLVALGQDRSEDASSSFAQADKETKALMREGDLFNTPGESFLEQLLRAVANPQTTEDRISPHFCRDLHFLIGIAQLRSLHEHLAEASASTWRSALMQIETKLEQSVSIAPDFGEGWALLGLLYYYMSGDDAKREKGIDILRLVANQLSSRFVTQTVAQYDAEQKRQADARKAYFDMLQQYLQFSNVPLAQRTAMRNQVLDGMKAIGQYEQFVGQGHLEIEAEREHEPTVQEYIDRAGLLREKLTGFRQSDQAGNMPPKVRDLMDRLGTHNQELQQHVRMIAQLEQELLLAAQSLLAP